MHRSAYHTAQQNIMLAEHIINPIRDLYHCKRLRFIKIEAFCVARPEGFEPPAFRIGICCDIQLRYGRMCKLFAHRVYHRGKLSAIILIK